MSVDVYNTPSNPTAYFHEARVVSLLEHAYVLRLLNAVISYPHVVGAMSSHLLTVVYDLLASLGVWAAAGNLFPMQASMQHNSAARWLPREADTPRFGTGLL